MNKTILEIHDVAKNSVEKIELELVDGAYCSRVASINEAHKYTLPGDTITIKYAIFNTDKECVDSFEVDYTFPETRIHTENAVKEDGTKFDRIVTYFSNTKFGMTIDRIGLQKLYDDVKNREITTFHQDDESYCILMAEIWFYSNYLTRQPNVAKKNIIQVNSNNAGFQP